ncbi:MAG: hypothetical protein WC267_03600 [Bacilli bacterium]
MKIKILLPLIVALLLGYLFGYFVFEQYDKKPLLTFKPKTTVYFLQQGVYSNLESMTDNTRRIENYIYIKDGDYYKTYVAITSDSNNINKLKELFIALGNDIYVKELPINNNQFISILKQYDLLLNQVTDYEGITTITKEVLLKYKELEVANGSFIN